MIFVIPVYVRLLPLDEAECRYRNSLAKDVLNDSHAMAGVQVMLDAARSVMDWVFANDEDALVQDFLRAVVDDDTDARDGAVAGIAAQVGGNAAGFFLGDVPDLYAAWPDPFEFFECVWERVP